MQTAIYYNGVKVFTTNTCPETVTYDNGILRGTINTKNESLALVAKPKQSFTTVIPGCKSVYKNSDMFGTYYFIRK